MPFNLADSGGNVTYGLTPYTKDELLTKLNENIIANVLAADPTAIIDTSEESFIGKVNEVLSQRLATLWEELGNVEDAFYVSKAFGNSLDKLVMQVGFLREGDNRSIGELCFYGEDGTIIPADTVYSSIRGDEFFNPEEVIITLQSCLSFNITVGVAKTGRDYTVTIDSSIYTFTSVDDNPYNILQGLKNEIDSDESVTTILSEDLEEDTYLEIIKIDDTIPMNCVVSPLLLPNSVQVSDTILSVEGGVIFGDADTITTIVNTVEGLDSVNNPKDFILGSEEESDEELITRATSDFKSVGSGTQPTITSIINQLDNVRGVNVEANRLYTTNENNIPPKSYEVIISHDTNEEEIAQLIWETKPAGLSTYGQNSLTITDEEGDEHTVHYTNAEELFAYVKIDYTLLDSGEGEVFPVGGELAIAEAVTTQGLSYNIGEDLIGKRLYGTVYNTVEGVDDVDIYLYVSTSSDEDINAITGWQEIIEIARDEISSFAVNRVLLTDITP